eukprot:168385-Pleurochrysis_carterae.AAC.1
MCSFPRHIWPNIWRHIQPHIQPHIGRTSGHRPEPHPIAHARLQLQAPPRLWVSLWLEAICPIALLAAPESFQIVRSVGGWACSAQPGRMGSGSSDPMCAQETQDG